ncbi:NAD(P)/FAD-dependent oxidoreductase [Maribacter sp. 2210JD10-5]|uniref:NAD(P)/FAD-dependent oxidoreductase n=1 Tax=Maribacter sp. 2210JD10-5 TaxID=3386272 RepID=UPI0039BD6742
MKERSVKEKICAIVGASHAGVNLAFYLRREGFEGEIILFDKDAMLPYHRPPLSKTYLANEEALEKNLLKSVESYEKERIQLRLGIVVTAISRKDTYLVLEDDQKQHYDFLVLATGARPLFPPIPNIQNIKNIFPLRTAHDIINIRQALTQNNSPKVVIIGGGYIGLETAASLTKLGAKVTILEREKRVLARVTTAEMSSFFTKLHTENGVEVHTEKNVIGLSTNNDMITVACSDTTTLEAHIVIVGIGIKVNTELAEAAGLETGNGIHVNSSTVTKDPKVYAIGDCTFHHNPHYDKYVRLESVQNAVDQAKVAAAKICDKEVIYDAIPWFWSDQYDTKLQIVGLSEGYDNYILRKEQEKENCFSIWYFKGTELLAVDAINNAKAYVIGTKFIKEKREIDLKKLKDISIPLKPTTLLVD